MSEIVLTCEETPLAFPKSSALEDLKTCSTCGIKIFSPTPGSLQILTRRQNGGVGDGVNIEESPNIGADYRGQRYTYQEAIFHVPGLHVFPGQDAVYPAEYHIHFTTFSNPKRSVTLVIPVSHRVKGPGKEYYAAMAAQPDPTTVKPTLHDVLLPGTQLLQYQGPDIRGRTAEVPQPGDQCSSQEERQFLLVLRPTQIRAADLERIPREGSISTDPRDLPAPGITPSKKIPRDRILRTVLLANPGILGPKKKEKENKERKEKAAEEAEEKEKKGVDEVECKPIHVVNGRDVVDISGKAVDILKLLGLDNSETKTKGESSLALEGGAFVFFIGVFGGLLFSDWIFTKVWSLFFSESQGRLAQWEPLKIIIFLILSISSSAYSKQILQQLGF
jgi:hypothetical protein